MIERGPITEYLMSTKTRAQRYSERLAAEVRREVNEELDLHDTERDLLEISIKQAIRRALKYGARYAKELDMP